MRRLAEAGAGEARGQGAHKAARAREEARPGVAVRGFGQGMGRRSTATIATGKSGGSREELTAVSRESSKRPAEGRGGRVEVAELRGRRRS